MNKEEAIRVVRAYNRDIKRPDYTMRHDEFYHRSLCHWACDELLRELYFSEIDSADYIIEQFSMKMTRYSCMNKYMSYAYSVAHEVSEDILDILEDLKVKEKRS